MKNYKKLIIIICCISVCLISFVLIQAYAKYITSTSGNANITIARWNILVNNLSIKNNTSITSTIRPIFEGNPHIADGVIAPTAKGYFDLLFDTTSADVSFHYDITLSVNPNSAVKDLIVTGYSINDGEEIPFTMGSTISDTILYADKITNRKIRIFVKWDDNADTTTMDDLTDAKATIGTTGAVLDIAISFKQVAS